MEFVMVSSLPWTWAFKDRGFLRGCSPLLLFRTGLKCCLLDPSWALRPSLLGTSLVDQWFRLHASTVGGLGSFCGGERRSRTPHNTAVYSQLTFVYRQLIFDKGPRILSGKRASSPMNNTEKIVQPPIKEWNWRTTLEHEQKSTQID